MSEEQANTQSGASTPSIENASVGTEQNTENTQAKTGGYDRIDFSKLPEEVRAEIEPRFHRMYGQVKAQDRKFTEAMDVMRQQSEVIAELQKGVGNVVNHLNTQDFNNAEAKAREDADAAFKRGDSRAYLAATEKVAQLSAQKTVNQTLRQQTQQQQPQQPQQQKQPTNSARDVANRAAQQGLLDPADVSAFEAWQEERDNTGNLVRPWTKRETAGEGFDAALMRSASVFADPKYKNASIEQKLEAVDRMMGLDRQSPTQNVMGANLTAKAKTNNVKISADMEKVLNHLKPRGSKAKNAPDPIAWYKEQANKAKTRGATR